MLREWCNNSFIYMYPDYFYDLPSRSQQHPVNILEILLFPTFSLMPTMIGQTTCKIIQIAKTEQSTLHNVPCLLLDY